MEPPQSAKRVRHTRSVWEAFKPVIVELYRDQDKKLSEIQEILAKQGFTARLVSVSHSGSI